MWTQSTKTTGNTPQGCVPAIGRPAHVRCRPCGLCSTWNNAAHRYRQRLLRPAPASALLCKALPPDGRTPPPGPSIWPRYGDGSCRICPAECGTLVSCHVHRCGQAGNHSLYPTGFQQEIHLARPPSYFPTLSPSGLGDHFISVHACTLAQKFVPL